ncbi:ABC transporter permease [Alkalibacterium iburiense]|uniref:ABC transporter permease n=1 Tax=Alkalibacterium iburiense TaxID=290589 RepID=A0ABN0X0V3_9LACT
MTIQKLVFRSIQKNIRMYYLYFFAMIFSISLYFIFSSLQTNQTITEMGEASVNFSTAFQVAGILLIFITVVFTMYATNIFIKRRSQEIGLYQLIGLSKAWVARILILEHTILGIGALLVGMVVGVLLSRLFLLLFMNVIGIEAIVGLTFSGQAVLQTIIVFLCLIAVVTVQIIITVYHKTLIQLFRANDQSENFSKRPSITSGVLGIFGIGLIGVGYYASTLILEYTDILMFLMLFVLASTITGTYLIFRTTISWLMYIFRKQKNGHLGLQNSLSVASLMHRMKGHANSLTLITVLSAMTITMISLSYSLYYSTEEDVRMAMPFDFAVENMHEEAETISSRLQEEQINHAYHQLDAIRTVGKWSTLDSNELSYSRPMMIFSAEQLLEAGLEVEIPPKGEAVFHNNRAIIEGRDLTFPKTVQYETNEEVRTLLVSDYRLDNIMNYRFFGEQLLVSQETFEGIRSNLHENQNNELLNFDVFQIQDTEKSVLASNIFLETTDSIDFLTDYYSAYEESLHNYGVIIYIAGFLGFVFILSTGSILYFKQMTEAEQEKKDYKTLRQLGFQVKDIMKGIIRKQLFVYLIPLIIGLIHASFALNVGSVLMVSSMLTPILISMTVYIVIYLLFTVFTIRYYKSIVINAL